METPEPETSSKNFWPDPKVFQAAKVHSKLSTLQKVNFPLAQLSIDGDLYFNKLWRSIDGAKDYIWISMYHFDETRVGKITLHKLAQAAKRGKFS